MPRLLITLCLFLCLSVFLPGCSSSSEPLKSPNGQPMLRDGRYLSSYDAFAADPKYRDTRDVWYHDGRISRASTSNSRIVVNLATQRGILLVDGEVGMDFPVCTGKSTHETPRGRFSIIQKVEDYRSKSYGSVFNAAGKCVNSDATASSSVPGGGRFIGAKMPLWMRIHGGVGLHVGTVYRDANSHGCIRVPIEACRILFDKCGVGTPVVVQE